MKGALKPQVSGMIPILEHRARQLPEVPAIISPERRITYEEYRRLIRQGAGKLTALGLQPGQRVAFWSTNRWELIVLMMACWYGEMVAIPLNPKLPGENLRLHLDQVQAGALIVEKSLIGGLPDRLAPPVIELEGLFSGSPDRLPEGRWMQVDPELTFIFTSGTTGQPRAACHTWSNHYCSARGANQNIPLKAGDRWFISLPLFHVGGLAVLFRTLLAGATIVVPEDRQITPDIIQTFQITHVSMVATQLQRFVNSLPAQGFRSSLKCILVGGGPIPPHLIQKALEQHLPVFTTYGSTEMSSQITTTRPGDNLQRLLTAGRPLPYREVQIAPDGEILVKGPTLFKGYWDGGKLQLPVDEEGWFHTGDIGRWTIDGYLKVIGRKDNMFVSGGENIHPEEIEAMLMRLPGVKQALVVPLPHPEFGARPVAFLEMEPNNHPLDAEQLRGMLQAFLPRFKIPDHFLPWPVHTHYMVKPNRKVFQEIARQKISAAP